MKKNRAAFSNYNMVRMREAIRYFTPEKLEIFIKIPFLLHINSPEFPGFTGKNDDCHGIFNFENSGFYKEAVKTKIFPKSIIADTKVAQPAVLGFYHIGSLGTFTQSHGSDFDYWVIIDRKKFSRDRYHTLEKKLDDLLKYSREAYDQEVTFFIMDQKDIKKDCYARFEGEETLTAPKVFLKEEFYRTFLMIAGKIPVWAVLPGPEDPTAGTGMNAEGVTAQVLSMYDDLIDLGQIEKIPEGDVFKGLLWHICKSVEDPVKAVIKATMVFSYGLTQTSAAALLCEKIKNGYADAGIDDYGVDPYKALFDRILEFSRQEDPKGVSLIKNAIFFRLCHFPDVKLPDNGTPKRHLLDEYIRDWKLTRNQVGKLLSYSTWSEAEKLLLEKTFIQQLARMYNQAVQKTGRAAPGVAAGAEKRNWTILKNKIRERLQKKPNRIPGCSTYLRRQTLVRLEIKETSGSWNLGILTGTGRKIDALYTHAHLLGVFGWILENQLYHRHGAVLHFDTERKLFESMDTPIDADRLYMASQPLKPLSDACFELDAAWSRMMILLFFDTVQDKKKISKAEVLISNTWGELILETLGFARETSRDSACRAIARLMLQYPGKDLRLSVYQFSDTRDPGIVYEIKKAYNEASLTDTAAMPLKKKPYLDRL